MNFYKYSLTRQSVVHAFVSCCSMRCHTAAEHTQTQYGHTVDRSEKLSPFNGEIDQQRHILSQNKNKIHE